MDEKHDDKTGGDGLCLKVQDSSATKQKSASVYLDLGLLVSLLLGESPTMRFCGSVTFRKMWGVWKWEEGPR